MHKNKTFTLLHAGLSNCYSTLLSFVKDFTLFSTFSAVSFRYHLILTQYLTTCPPERRRNVTSFVQNSKRGRTVTTRGMGSTRRLAR